MKKIYLKLFFTFLLLINLIPAVHALQFDVLVLPTDLFSVCDNYFCFPEPSEITANYVIHDLNNYRNISAIDLSEIRVKLYSNSDLKEKTEAMLVNFGQNDKIDFAVLKELSQEFNVKSVILISSYAITDSSIIKRDLWEVLELSSAFKITYPFNLTTTAVLTDTVNSVVMWSSKYNKTVSNSNGYFLALTQSQAACHLEKLKQYFKHNVSENISQNVFLRFFPKDVRTFSVKKQDDEDNTPKFVPNALEHLIQPQMMKEIEDGASNMDSEDDFVFDF
jgi:hypothetical protein